jgi:AAA domain-containing protein
MGTEPPGITQVREAIAGLRTTTGTVLIAIDGLAGSGKTTVADELVAADSRLRILHADELQRPQAEGEWVTWTQRQAATNFVLEAPLRDLLATLAAGHPAEYRAYDWSAHRLGPATTVIPGGIVVVEGAYTLRPSLRRFFGLRIWVDCDEQIRAARLRARPAPSTGWLQAWLAGERFYVTQDGVLCCGKEWYAVASASQRCAPMDASQSTSEPRRPNATQCRGVASSAGRPAVLRFYR